MGNNEDNTIESTKMGKLKEMVVEDASFASRVKYNGRRIQLAGIGLFAKIVEASGKKNDESVIGKLNALGTGTVNLVREESQRIFDDLVEAGEAFAEKTDQPKSAGNKVAKRSIKPAKPAAADSKPNTSKPTRNPQASKPKKATRVKKAEIDPELKKAFDKAKAKAAKAGDLPKDKSLKLMALAKQVEEGDVKGRRPAKTKVEACEEFDARRELKGMKQDEAINQYIELVNTL